MQETQVWSLGQEDLEKGMATHYSNVCVCVYVYIISLDDKLFGHPIYTALTV